MNCIPPSKRKLLTRKSRKSRKDTTAAALSANFCASTSSAVPTPRPPTHDQEDATSRETIRHKVQSTLDTLEYFKGCKVLFTASNTLEYFEFSEIKARLESFWKKDFRGEWEGILLECLTRLGGAMTSKKIMEKV